MTVKGFFIWHSRSKKTHAPLEDWGKRKFPSYFKIKPIILEEKKTPNRLLSLTVTLISGLLLTLCNSVCLSRGYEILLCRCKWRWRQQRLTIENSVLLQWHWELEMIPLSFGGEDLTLSPLPAQTQHSASSSPPGITPQLLPGSPISFPGSELSMDKVLSAVLDLLFNPSLWNARSVFPCHKNKPFLLFFLVSLKINRASTSKPQTKHRVSSITLESLPWIKRDSKTPIPTA